MTPIRRSAAALALAVSLCSCSPPQDGDRDGGKDAAEPASCKQSSYDVRLAENGGTCIQWGETNIVRRDLLLMLDWGPLELEDPLHRLSLTWNGIEIPLTGEGGEPLEEAFSEGYQTPDGCWRAGVVAKPHRPLAASEYQLTFYGDVDADGEHCGRPTDGAIATLRVEGPGTGTRYSYCAGDRPSCSADADCGAPWVCVESLGECHLWEEPWCLAFDDPHAFCRAHSGDPSDECVSCGNHGADCRSWCASPGESVTGGECDFRGVGP